MNENKVRFSMDIEKDYHRRLKALAALHDKTLREVILEAIKESIKRLEKVGNL